MRTRTKVTIGTKKMIKNFTFMSKFEIIKKDIFVCFKVINGYLVVKLCLKMECT